MTKKKRVVRVPFLGTTKAGRHWSIQLCSLYLRLKTHIRLHGQLSRQQRARLGVVGVEPQRAAEDAGRGDAELAGGQRPGERVHEGEGGGGWLPED